MLRTNTKKATQNLNDYILETFQDYNGQPTNDIKFACDYILAAFYNEQLKPMASKPSAYYETLYEAFKDWMQGLPSVIGGKYYYNVNAVDLLGGILEETEEEKARFTERQAEEKLTQLLFNTITKNAPAHYRYIIKQFINA